MTGIRGFAHLGRRDPRTGFLESALGLTRRETAEARVLIFSHIWSESASSTAALQIRKSLEGSDSLGCCGLPDHLRLPSSVPPVNP